jgi:LPPG:FO 2-phospho-L-lactate transferase
VQDAIATADAILICPSNPVVSIGPILEVAGLRAAVREAAAPVAAVSPIIGGAPVKGPADRLLRGLGVEVSALGVAGLYRDLLAGYVLDIQDADQEPGVAALGLETRVLDTLMRDSTIAANIARAALELTGIQP